MANGDFRRFISEWQPVTLSNSPIFVPLALAAVAIVACAPIPRRDKLLVWALTLAGFTAIRSELWAALAWIVVLPDALERMRSLDGGRRVRAAAVAFCAIAPTCLVLAIAHDASSGPGDFATNWPRAAARVVQGELARDPGLRVFADEPFADWVLVQVPAARGRLALDSRFETFDHGEFAALDALRAQPPEISPTIAKEQLYVLQPSAGGDGRLVHALESEPGVVRLFGNARIVVLRRRSSGEPPRGEPRRAAEDQRQHRQVREPARESAERRRHEQHVREDVRRRCEREQRSETVAAVGDSSCGTMPRKIMGSTSASARIAAVRSSRASVPTSTPSAPIAAPAAASAGTSSGQPQPRLAAAGALQRDRDPERDREQAAEDDARDRSQQHLLDDQLGPAREPAREPPDHVLVALEGDRAGRQQHAHEAERDGERVALQLAAEQVRAARAARPRAAAPGARSPRAFPRRRRARASSGPRSARSRRAARCAGRRERACRAPAGSSSTEFCRPSTCTVRPRNCALPPCTSVRR